MGHPLLGTEVTQGLAQGNRSVPIWSLRFRLWIQLGTKNKMTRKRKRFSRPQYGRKSAWSGRRWKKTKYSRATPMSVPEAIRVLNTRVAGFAGIENKFYDEQLAVTAIPLTWASRNPAASHSLSVPLEGTGESERNGRVYHISKVMVHGLIEKPRKITGQPYADIRVRVVLYLDTQTNGAEATPGEIMDIGGTDDVLAFRNLQHSKRFQVLKQVSKVLRLDNQTAVTLVSVAAPARKTPFSMYYDFKEPLRVQCDATTANVSSCTDNNIGIICIADEADVNISYTSRVRFRG